MQIAEALHTMKNIEKMISLIYIFDGGGMENFFLSLPSKLCGWSKGVINVNSWASSSDFSTFTLHHFRQMSDLFMAIVKLHINEGRE